MNWRTGYNWKDTDGTSGHIITEFDRSFYVSSNGRIFAQSSKSILRRGGRGGGMQASGIQSGQSSGPDGAAIRTANHHGKGSFAWNGRELIGVVPAVSGAFHLHVLFDESFRSCTLNF